MGLLELPRVAEPEVMDDQGDVEAYSSAAAQAFLEKIDWTFVEHALRLVDEKRKGHALDLGTGPGQIVLKLARRMKPWKFVGVDRSPNMIAHAREVVGSEPGDLGGRVEFQVGDGNQLDFADASFDLVMCNSLLHHLSEPRKVLAEMARVAKPNAAILLRDLRRPGRLAYSLHVRWHGRHYSGAMYRLYCDSVRAAYTLDELKSLLDNLRLPGARVFERGATHIGIERKARDPVAQS